MSTSEPSRPTRLRFWNDAGTLTQVAVVLVILTTGWFLLRELAPLLRPLLLAGLLCYVILPLHSKLLSWRKSEFVTIAILVGGTVILMISLGLIFYLTLIDFQEELPRLINRGEDLMHNLKRYSDIKSPWVSRSVDEALSAEKKGEPTLHMLTNWLILNAADALREAFVVGLYLIFLLMEVKRLQHRVKGGFSTDSAQQILDTIHTINIGISSYLRAKVKSSLILAVPVLVLLLAMNVKFAVFWALLTFLCNFIPYVGSVVACGSPIAFAFLDFDLGWAPITVMAGLLLIHLLCASFVEPTLLGKAVGLSPLMILLSLTFWGLVWGLMGMFLAVPMTVVFKIVMANIETTKPIASLLGDE